MKDKLINALASEYEAVYLINLKEDTYDIVKALKGSNAMISTNCWSKASKAFESECSDDSRPIIKTFSDVSLLRVVLSNKDFEEFTFKHIKSDSLWRKISVHVIERECDVPVLILMTVSIIDKISVQKEKILNEIFIAKSGEKNSELPIYKKIVSELDENYLSDHKLFNHFKILLVEDNDILRLISKDVLEKEGASVSEAQDGLKAVDLVKSNKPFDFIIMDIVMPVLDGIEATKQIVEYYKTKDIKCPIFGLTADASEEQKNKIINVGAYACLTKPLNPKEISKIFISYMKEKSILMEERMAEINLLAHTDLLTKSGNIVAYTHDIAELTKKLNENTNNIAIVICDLDNLKLINDTYGHDVGDIYIKNCCSFISNTFSKSKLYRVGGDEFALIVLNASLDTLENCINVLNDKSRAFDSLQGIGKGNTSVSAGYAFFNSKYDQSLSDTMKRADMAMYENKQLHKKWREIYSKIR